MNSASEDLRDLARILHLSLSQSRKEYSGAFVMREGHLEFERVYPEDHNKTLLKDLTTTLLVLFSERSEIETVLNEYSFMISEPEAGRYVFQGRSLSSRLEQRPKDGAPLS